MLGDIAARLFIIPAATLQPGLEAALSILLRRHPALFDRLGEHRAKSFAFLPTGSPLAFLVRPALSSITLTRLAAARRADVVIGGDLVLLLALLEGRIDGDSIFFSRELSVAGDMEAVVALRNSLDDCEIDLPEDLSSLAGPFSLLFAALGRRIRKMALAGAGARPWS